MIRYKDKLTYTIFLLLLMGIRPLQAAQCNEGTTFKGKAAHKMPAYQPNKLFPAAQNLEVYDHTVHIGKHVNNEITEEDEDTFEDILHDHMLLLKDKLDNSTEELILAAVLQSKQDKKYYKHLFSSKGLLQGEKIVTTVYKKRYGYHLIKTTSPHVIVALLEWLSWSQQQLLHNSTFYSMYNPKTLSASQSVCKSCGLIARYMFEIALPYDEKGCKGQPLLDSIEALPHLAQQYINTHLTLPLVQELIVPMLGYVKDTHVNQKQAALKARLTGTNIAMKAQINQKNMQLQEKDRALRKLHEQITALKIEISQNNMQLQKKDEALQAQQEQYRALQAQSDQKEKSIASLEKNSTNRHKVILQKNKEIDELKVQLQEKDRILQPYYQQQQQQIFAQITKVNNQLKSPLPDVDITNEDSVKAFVQAVEIHFQPLLEIRTLYAKYKGGTENDYKGWKMCWELNKKNWVKRENNEGLYWGNIYNKIEKKLKHCTQISEKFSIFFKITQDIDTILHIKNSRLYGVSEFLEKIKTKEETYQIEMVKFNNKLKLSSNPCPCCVGWRWLNSIIN